MAYSDRYTGAALVLEFTPTAGVLTTVSGDQKSVQLTRSQDVVDATAANETAKSSLKTQVGMEVAISIFAGNEQTYKLLKEGATGLLSIYPQGKSAGKPLRSFNIIVTKFDETWPFDNISEVEITATRNGASVADIGDVV